MTANRSAVGEIAMRIKRAEATVAELTARDRENRSIILAQRIQIANLKKQVSAARSKQRERLASKVREVADGVGDEK